MAVSLVPEGGIVLKGYAEHGGKAHGSSTAILLKLDGGAVQDIRKAADLKNGLQFLTGNTPVCCDNAQTCRVVC